MEGVCEVGCVKERQEDGMNNRDWERFGEDIRRTIQDAVEYGNYDRLNQTITNTVNQATDWVNRNIGSKVQQGYGQSDYQKSYEPNSYRQPDYSDRTRQKELPERFRVNASSKAAGVLQTVFGYLFGAPLLVWALILLIAGIVLGKLEIEFWIVSILSLLLLGGFTALAVKGTLRLMGLHRFRMYKKEIGTAELCNISALAFAVGKSTDYVMKDIEKMIKKGWFRQGHLDKQKTCLIVTNQMYHQYLALEEQREAQQMEEARKQGEEQRARQSKDSYRKGLSSEVQKVIEQGDAYVKKIRECNDAIPGEEISAKISRMEKLVDRIFDRVEQNPDSVSDIRKLMEYYLPTTVKLLEAYAQMDAQPADGENIQTAKREIEATLDTLNVAFEKLLDSLFQEAAWDVSSDISVLNTMLAQEGLKDDGLKKERK